MAKDLLQLFINKKGWTNEYFEKFCNLTPGCTTRLYENEIDLEQEDVLKIASKLNTELHLEGIIFMDMSAFGYEGKIGMFKASDENTKDMRRHMKSEIERLAKEIEDENKSEDDN